MITLIDKKPVLKLAADATFSNAGEVYAYMHETHATDMSEANYLMGPVRVLRFAQSIYYKGYSVNFPWKASSFFQFAHHVAGTDVIQYDLAESGFAYVWNAVLPGTETMVLAVGYDDEYADDIVYEGHPLNRMEMMQTWAWNPESVMAMIIE